MPFGTRQRYSNIPAFALTSSARSPKATYEIARFACHFVVGDTPSVGLSTKYTTRRFVGIV